MVFSANMAHYFPSVLITRLSVPRGKYCAIFSSNHVISVYHSTMYSLKLLNHALLNLKIFLCGVYHYVLFQVTRDSSWKKHISSTHNAIKRIWQEVTTQLRGWVKTLYIMSSSNKLTMDHLHICLFHLYRRGCVVSFDFKIIVGIFIVPDQNPIGAFLSPMQIIPWNYSLI